MELSKRLQTVAGMVSEGNRLVDVGTDHGYIPIYLVEQKKIPSAIAMDVRKGPLSRAREHVASAGLQVYITCRLSDGLANLSEKEGDSLLLAGMGGNLMVRILTEKPQVRDSFKEIILQPQSAQALVRRTMEEAGWQVAEEAMVLEDGKFYPMLRLVPEKEWENASVEAAGEMPEGEKENSGRTAPYRNQAEYTYGKLLLREKNPVLKEYLDKRQQVLTTLSVQLKGQPERERSLSARERLKELEEELAVLGEAMEYYNE